MQHMHAIKTGEGISSDTYSMIHISIFTLSGSGLSSGNSGGTYLGGCGAGAGVGATGGTVVTTRLGLAISSPGTIIKSVYHTQFFHHIVLNTLSLKVNLA